MPSAVKMPLLSNFICHVVCVRTKKEMIGINTLRHITFMTDNHSLRNVAVGNFIGDAMGIFLTTADVYPTIT